MKSLQTPLVTAAVLAALLLGACAQNAPVATAATPAAPVAVPAKAVPGDAAIAIVELMPLIMRYEADLKFTPAQVKALADYRQANMPKRVALQKQILTLRGQLRQAMLQGQPTAELMRQVSQAELQHMQARERCVDFVRKTLTPAQYAQLTRLYLDGLR